MIRIDKGAEVSPGVWEFRSAVYPVCGKSRQPLLDACRQLKLILGDTSQRAGLFRTGHDEPDISCSVEVGAGLTVAEDAKNSPRFRKYQPFDMRVLREAAE